MSICPSLIKRAYDFITLGKFKWLLALLIFLAGGVSKVIYQRGIGFNYLLPKAIAYYPHDIHYWGQSGHLPDTWQRLIIWQNVLWVESELYSAVGIPLSIVTILVLLIAYLRGE